MATEHRLILKNIDRQGYDTGIECYLKHGGYNTLKAVLSTPERKMPDGRTVDTPAWLRNEVLVSGLRGRGGAGFPCGRKWAFINHGSGKPVYLICNADESEPGTFKDKQIIYKDPHQLLEGMILSCYANHVHLAYIYIRGEFYEGARILKRALAEARSKNLLGEDILGSGYDLEIYVHRGAGAYICGEETGLIESLEGRRPYPRIKPPYFPAAFGLYMSPTIVNNVETLCAVRHVIEMGGSRYGELGVRSDPGTRILSVSGHVRKPGYYEIEIGKVTFGELIYDLAGGLAEGRKLKAVIPGGTSAKVLRADERFKLRSSGGNGESAETEIGLLELPFDSDSVAAAGSMCGSGGVIVLDDSADMIDVLRNISGFYAHESCGQCTPCREGSLWMSKALNRIACGGARYLDAEYLLSISDGIAGGKTVCAFGEACAWPVMSFVEKFRGEFEARAAADESRSEEENADMIVA
ncbi:MAG: NADH-quinone oxidoreductase subunit NuoF [Verrucomicrobia bacterium]|nr:NADH-quinone oxidoreductase subunit NuoF [Verrucomicrobiota bacterium]MCF7708464.1 NADH-quinone oxidoreductase subunit NuoF [Verrucomicrobiota bacterium]